MRAISIAAAINGTPGCYRENTNDKVFSCISSDGPCQVQVGSKAAQSCISGLVIGDPSGDSLQSITLLNFGSVAVNVTFETGTTAVKGATPTSPIENFFNLPIFGNAGSVGGTRALPPGNGAVIPGTQVINGAIKTRQYIEITNLDAAALIYVFTDHLNGGNLDQCVGIVFPNSFRRFDLKKNLVLGNISGAAIQCTAYEQY